MSVASNYPHLAREEFYGSRIYALSNVNADGVGLCSMSTTKRINGSALRVLQSIDVLTLFSGGLLAYNGIKEFSLANRLKDFWGKVISFETFGMGGLQFLAGGASLGVLLANIANLVHVRPVATVAASILGNFAGGFMSAAGAMALALYLTQFGFSLRAALRLKEIDLPSLKKELETNETGLLWKKVLSASSIERVLKSDGSDAELLKNITREIQWGLFVNGMSSLLATVGITLGVLSFFAVPISPWILIGIGVGIGLLGFGLDAVEFKEEIHESFLSTREKVGLYGITFFTSSLAAIASSIARDRFFGIMTMLSGLFLALVQLYMIYTMQENTE